MALLNLLAALVQLIAVRGRCRDQHNTVRADIIIPVHPTVHRHAAVLEEVIVLSVQIAPAVCNDTVLIEVVEVVTKLQPARHHLAVLGKVIPVAVNLPPADHRHPRIVVVVPAFVLLIPAVHMILFRIEFDYIAKLHRLTGLPLLIHRIALQAIGSVFAEAKRLFVILLFRTLAFGRFQKGIAYRNALTRQFELHRILITAGFEGCFDRGIVAFQSLLNERRIFRSLAGHRLTGGL